MAIALRPCAAKALILHRALVANFSAGCLMAVDLPPRPAGTVAPPPPATLPSPDAPRNARAPAPPPPAGCATTAPRPPAAAPQPAAPLAGPPIPWGKCSRAHGAGCAWALGAPPAGAPKAAPWRHFLGALIFQVAKHSRRGMRAPKPGWLGLDCQPQIECAVESRPAFKPRRAASSAVGRVGGRLADAVGSPGRPGQGSGFSWRLRGVCRRPPPVGQGCGRRLSV